MKGWVGLVGWPVADGLPTLVVTHQLQVERRTGKFAIQRPAFYHCATPPTFAWVQHANQLPSHPLYTRCAWYIIKSLRNPLSWAFVASFSIGLTNLCYRWNVDDKTFDRVILFLSRDDDVTPALRAMLRIRVFFALSVTSRCSVTMADAPYSLSYAADF